MKKMQRNTFFISDRIIGSEKYDIIYRTPIIVKVLKEIRDRKRLEKHFLNFNNPKIGQLTKEHSVKQQRNDAQKPRKTKAQKLSEQIQRGFDIAEKWRKEQNDKI